MTDAAFPPSGPVGAPSPGGGAPQGHAHYFLIESPSPDKTELEGECRDCGETRCWPASLDFYGRHDWMWTRPTVWRDDPAWRSNA